jgi:hypothetical protein
MSFSNITLKGDIFKISICRKPVIQLIVLISFLVLGGVAGNLTRDNGRVETNWVPSYNSPAMSSGLLNIRWRYALVFLGLAIV